MQEKDEDSDCVKILVQEFRKVGFIVERVHGIAEEFIKVRLPNALLFMHHWTSFSY